MKTHEITTERDGDVAVLHLRGEIGLALREQARQALHWIAAADRPVVVDLGEVTFLDSSGVTFLLQCRRACQESGTRCTLRRVPSPVAHVLTLLGLTDVLPIETTLPVGAS